MERVQAKDSRGSDWIIQTLEKADDRPLWIAVWGGTNTLAQVPYKLRAAKTTAELDRLVAKLRVYSISDQDDSGPWIRKNFPKRRERVRVIPGPPPRPRAMQRSGL